MALVTILEFLTTVRKSVCSIETFSRVVAVMGNESCDLDSAISALVYGLFMYLKNDDPETAIIPILDVPKEDIRLKTEVTYFMKINNIPLNMLVYKNEINLEQLHTQGKLQLILVDHHTLSRDHANLKNAVVKVIDHRPVELDWNSESVIFVHNQVGSCCTLIANELLQENEALVTKDVAMLLYGPIVVDTACFSVQAKRATELDHKIALELENRIGSTIDRKEIFKQLMSAKEAFDELTSFDLLRKDMKIIMRIPIAGLPTLVHNFIKRSDVENALVEFLNKFNTNVCVVMGLQINEDQVTRDIAVFSTSSSVLKELTYHLQNSKSPHLQLTQTELDSPRIALYKQGNILVSRKQLVPLVKTIVPLIQDIDNTCSC